MRAGGRCGRTCPGEFSLSDFLFWTLDHIVLTTVALGPFPSITLLAFPSLFWLLPVEQFQRWALLRGDRSTPLQAPLPSKMHTCSGLAPCPRGPQGSPSALCPLGLGVLLSVLSPHTPRPGRFWFVRSQPRAGPTVGGRALGAAQAGGRRTVC